MADAGAILALFLALFFMILLKPRSNVIWTRREMKRLEPESYTLTQMYSINGNAYGYFYCTKTNRLYRLRGDDFVYIQTKPLSELAWLKGKPSGDILQRM